MSVRLSLAASFGVAVVLATGCGSPAKPKIDWTDPGINFGDTAISLGFRPTDSGETIEPVASIVRKGEAVAGAMVFVSLAASEKPDSAKHPSAPDEEFPTLFEYQGGRGVYAASLLRRDDAKGVRFRIVLPNQEADWIRKVPIPTPKA